MAASNYMTFFYKDDEMIGNSSSGKLTLNKVFKTDEGVYKCQTSEDRESEEQWLAVRGTSFITSDSSGATGSTWTLVSGLAALPLLLIVLVFIYKKCKSHRGPTSRHQATTEYEQPTEIYSVIENNKTARNQNAREPSNDAPREVYSTVNKKKKNQRQSSETTVYAHVRKNKGKRPRDVAENTVYSLLKVDTF
ncbi:hypothetical protein NL108_016121 [Boleophthalmus pectinirostris]|nr:hypothetical protein NL108_016121 [Boleophthalmus pectinirostris]